MHTIREEIIEGVRQDENLMNLYDRLSGKLTKPAFFKAVLDLIQEEIIPNVLICYCGHDCARCRVFLATINDDHDLREQSAAYYQESLKTPMSLDNLYCLSARSDEVMVGCRQCPFMKCAKDKSLSICEDCQNHPCQTLAWYTDTYVNKTNQV